MSPYEKQEVELKEIELGGLLLPIFKCIMNILMTQEKER